MAKLNKETRQVRRVERINEIINEEERLAEVAAPVAENCPVVKETEKVAGQADSLADAMDNYAAGCSWLQEKADKAEAWNALKEERKQAKKANKMDGVAILNDGNPEVIGSEKDGFLFTVSPSTAKKGRAYYTDKMVPLTDAELKMPGVVVCQNRGMLFSSCHKISGDYVIPKLGEINLIIVDEVSRKLTPVDDAENKIAWKGNGEHVVKDVCADGQAQHWFCHADGRFADDLWFKIAKFGYGVKGMIQPGLATDVGVEVIDHWGVVRRITMGNTILLNSSLVKGLGAYNSLEELIAHGEEWGLTTMMKQWQSGDHKPAKRRILGTQANATNLAQTFQDIEELLKPEAREIWATKFEKVAWMKTANIATSRGRAFAARPSLMNKDLVMNQIDSKAGNTFLRLAQGKFMAKGEYLKMFMDKLVYSLVYVHGMDYNEAAKKAAETGLHGELRVNPAFAGAHYIKNENGQKELVYSEPTFLDGKGRYIESALVRYPHGAASETIVVKLYLDATVPVDVIVFPAPAANDDGTILVALLYAMRLQGADFDGDAVTAFKERVWLEAQKRNIGKAYMVIPVNTESTEKDKTLVTDETFEEFCKQKVEGLSNLVGLIATSLKYFFSQCADLIAEGFDPETIIRFIVDHACAMGDDIDEFKHGKANNELVPFIVEWKDKPEWLGTPYFVRYAAKYRSKDAFEKAIYKISKDGKSKVERKPGSGKLDMYAVTVERLMKKSGLPIVKEQTKASDGKDRYYFTVHPVQWESREVDLHIAKGEGQLNTSLPAELETLYGVERGTKFTAKDLFRMLYRDHAATCKQLLGACDEDDAVKALVKINERYALAKIAIVAWTKAMKKAKEGVELTGEEALRVFTTLLVQHNKSGRSALDTLTEICSVKRSDGTVYEKTAFDAQRWFNYFLDVCGDGLLFIGTEEPDFPEVSEKVIEAVHAKTPDLEKAKKLAQKEVELIDKLASKLNSGLDTIVDEIDEYYRRAEEETFDSAVLDDGTFFASESEEYDYPDEFADYPEE